MYFRVEHSDDGSNWTLLANVRTKFQIYEFQSKSAPSVLTGKAFVKGFNWANHEGHQFRVIENSTNAVPDFDQAEYEKLKARDVRNSVKKMNKLVAKE